MLVTPSGAGLAGYVAPGTRPNDMGMGYVALDPNRLPTGYAVPESPDVSGSTPGYVAPLGVSSWTAPHGHVPLARF